jgi:hypothetical protein
MFDSVPALNRSQREVDKPINSPQHDERPIFDLYAARAQSMIIEVALKIGMFDALRDPITASGLSERLSIGVRGTEILVAVLISSGLVTSSNGRLHLAAIAREYLTDESPFFKGPWFCAISSEELELIRSVHLQDGLPRPHTARWLDGTVKNPRGQGAGMHAHTFAAAVSFAKHVAFRTVGKLLDVGGGVGTLSIALAMHNPMLQCLVMDLPAIAAEAHRYSNEFGVADRVRFVSKNMFTDSWDTECDAILFSNILHDWDRHTCATLARKALVALPPRGRVFVNEMLLNETRDGPLAVTLFSASMLFSMQGQQLTFNELASLFTEAGFSGVEVLASFGYYSLIVCTK